MATRITRIPSTSIRTRTPTMNVVARRHQQTSRQATALRMALAAQRRQLARRRPRQSWMPTTTEPPRNPRRRKERPPRLGRRLRSVWAWYRNSPRPYMKPYRVDDKVQVRPVVCQVCKQVLQPHTRLEWGRIMALPLRSKRCKVIALVRPKHLLAGLQSPCFKSQLNCNGCMAVYSNSRVRQDGPEKERGRVPGAQERERERESQ